MASPLVPWARGVGWEGRRCPGGGVQCGGPGLFQNQPPTTKLGHFSADLRGDAGRSNREATHHRIRSARFAQTITLLAENLQDSVNSDPSFSPLADSFCRAARGRCKCRTSGAGGVLRGKHHFLSNLMGIYHHHPLRARRAAFGIKKFRFRGRHSAQGGHLPPTSRR